jgi:hypothetical protein
MALVKAPNGDVYDIADSVASGLVNSENAGWEYVGDEPKPVKRAAAKPDSFKSKK